MAICSGFDAAPDACISEAIPFIDLRSQQACIRAAVDRAIARVLDHGQYIMGPEVFELERQLAAFTGAKHVITCSSGTDALLLGLMALGVGVGDAVLCPGFTYTATPETIVLLGATPVFCDVDPRTFNLDPDRIASGAAAARALGLRPVGVIAVDLFGQPAAYDRLNLEAEREGLWVLADAAQSFGATYHEQRTGTLGRVSATSFFPAKPLGCYGDGGAAFTDDDDLAEIMRSIRLHGRGRAKYDVVRTGINGRLDTLQAAVLLEKLRIFPNEFVARTQVAQRYTAAFARADIAPRQVPGTQSAWAQYTILLPPDRRDAIKLALNAAGIPTEIYYPRALNEQVAYRSCPAPDGLPIALSLPKSVLSLPMHPYLDARAQAYITQTLQRLL